MIGFLRFVGLLNAADGFGAAVFYAFIAGPAFASPEMGGLLTPANFPFYSVAIAQIVASRYFNSNWFAVSSPSSTCSPNGSTWEKSRGGSGADCS